MTDTPQLTDEMVRVLRLITRGVASDPGYLKEAGYPEDVVQMFTHPVVVDVVEIEKIKLEDMDVSAEVEALFRDLKETRDGFTAGDNSEKMAYFRVATALLEKLVSLQERANNVRQIGRFYNEVITVLSEFLTPGKIGEVRARLVALTGGLAV